MGKPTFTTRKIYTPEYSFGSEDASISIIPVTHIDPRYDSTKRQEVPSIGNQYYADTIEEVLAPIVNDLAIHPELENQYREDRGDVWVNVALRRLAGRLPYDTDAHLAKMLNESLETPKKEIISGPNINDLVKQTILGKFGNGAARKAALGDNYAAVQALINKQLAGKRKPLKVDLPTIELKYVTIEPGHEPPTEPLDIPQYYIDRHFETTNTPLTGAEIAAIRIDPFNLHAMSEEEVDKVLGESPEERKLARSERRELRKENRAQRKEARKQRRLSRRSKNNKTE